MAIQQAIQKAIEGGYMFGYDYQHCKIKDNKTDHLFLDVEFWKCLGNALGNQWTTMHYDGQVEMRTWLYQWHCFIDSLAKGYSPEDYFKSL